ncbi:MAG TPA: MerR family DNA-binding transcriptional regulator [Acetobacteraceae bacterium]|nr:MerR family DNA-binding transcriptional regulator [Acetobacteraceae bacterium]
MQDHLYTVTQLARDLGLTPRALRFYEDKGLITPRRAGTTRVYTQRDRARMILIQRGKRLGFSLAEIREYLDLYDADITQRAQVRHLLAAVSSRLDQLLQQREALEQSITELTDIRTQAEAALAAHHAAESSAAD